MTRRLPLTAVICLILAALIWMAAQKLRGPALPAYEVVERPLVQTVVATGRVTALSRAQVGSPVTGVVLERRVREGDAVQPGDVLAVLRADDLEANLREAQAALAELEQSTRPRAEAALREARDKLMQAQREVQRRRSLLAQQAIPREELEQAQEAEAVARSAVAQAQLAARALQAGQPGAAAAQARVASAQAQLAKTTIRAEVAGTVLTRNAEPGDLVQPGRVLFEIARTGDTELLVPLDEKNLAVLALGQSALGIADAYPAQPFPATVSFIAPSVDPQRGTVDIRLAVRPLPEFLRQDMTVSVNVETGRRERALVVPNDALTLLGGDRAALWLVANGRAEWREVRLGLRGLTQSEVAVGLRARDLVLIDAPVALTPGDRVRALPPDSPLATPNPAASD